MKVFLIPPPNLPVPAVLGGAVEGLITGLIQENERQQAMELFCATIPCPDAPPPRYAHTQLISIPAPEGRRGFWYSRACGLSHRVGRPLPLDPWYGQVRKAVLRVKPDLVISEGGDPTELCAISRAVGRERCLLHLHGPTQGSPRLDTLYSGVLSLSEYTRQEFLAGSCLPPSQVQLLPNAIDLGHFRPAPPQQRLELRQELGFSPQDFVVLFCGRLAQEKGIHLLVDALAAIPDPHCKLLIVGSPFFGAQSTSPFLRELQNRAEPLGDRVRFTGFLPNRALPAYYSAADLACFPALWQEPAGLVAIEAMACGAPVLATRSGGMTEYLTGSEALLLEQEPTQTLAARLAQSIQALRADPQRLARMRRAGLDRAQAFGRAAYCRRFAQLLQAHRAAAGQEG